MLLTATILPLVVAAVGTSTIQTPQRQAVPKGKRVLWMGHSFHMFLPWPVASLAAEAGIQGHETAGSDMIPASYPCQHWEKNSNVKALLAAGKVDVLTISTRETAPDDCIPKFAELAYKGNKNIKIMVQETWLPVSSDEAEQCSDFGKRPGESVNGGITLCKNRDAPTVQTLEITRREREAPFKLLLRNQLLGINKQYRENLTSLVNVWEGVLVLREMIVQGQVPGITKQSSLFVDQLGHPQKPLKDFTSYIWFAAMYGITPVGTKALADETPAGQAEVLQKLAWDLLKIEPLNGLG